MKSYIKTRNLVTEDNQMPGSTDLDQLQKDLDDEFARLMPIAAHIVEGSDS